ncbi:hypothetical protein SAMN05444144_1149 [Flavobacterium akiainvivens]|nr:hypothetical protein SAMN05444144_1149 [Flavobacterium akiainvivens]
MYYYIIHILEERRCVYIGNSLSASPPKCDCRYHLFAPSKLKFVGLSSVICDERLMMAEVFTDLELADDKSRYKQLILISND